MGRMELQGQNGKAPQRNLRLGGSCQNTVVIKGAVWRPFEAEELSWSSTLPVSFSLDSCHLSSVIISAGLLFSSIFCCQLLCSIMCLAIHHEARP